jgi:hypothetical protein
MECGCIENTNLVDKNINTNPEYPNLHRMQMDGFDLDTGERGEIRYLCSECNTGIWHGEFEKTEATENEKEVASYSKFNFITLFDHPDGCLSGGFDKYFVDDRYKLFVKLFGKDVNGENNKLFKIYLEDRKNFNICCLKELDKRVSDGHALMEDDIKNAMARSHVYSDPTDVKSKTYLREVLGIGTFKSKIGMMLSGLAAITGIDLDDMIDQHVPKEKHWKELQSEADKEARLRKAELKREINSLKKQKPLDKVKLDELTEEYREL